MSPCAPRTADAAGGVRIRFFVDVQGASPLSTLCRPSGTLILPRHEPRGISLRYARRAFFTMGAAHSS